MNPLLTIIIVNYKTAHLVLDCIKSIQHFSQNAFEIIVMDNASDDNIENLLSANFPRVQFLQTGYNAGFARANNAAIKISNAPAILLLNSDTIILENAVEQCYKNLMASSYVAAGVQLLNADGSPQISGNFAMKGGLNYLLPLPVLGSFFKWLATIFGVKKTNVPEAKSLTEVDWINGAFLMVKKDAIEKAGMLDEDFFLYFEEAEWCSRLRKQGRLCIFGDLHVTHLQGESSGEAFASQSKGYYDLSDKKGFQIMLSCFLRIRKEFGAGWMLFLYFFYVINIPVYFLGFLFNSITGKVKENFFRWYGFTKNVLRILAYLPRIILGKPWFYKVL